MEGWISIEVGLQDGVWSKPENLGDKINTEGNEMFPFIHASGILIYASNGLPGLGGLDLFATKSDGKGGFGAVKNLGSPVNSNRDDFALILDKEMKTGYFSSNRESGKGDDDIYYYDLLKPLTFGKRIEGLATSSDGVVLQGVEVSLSDEVGNILESATTGEDGSYSFTADPETSYTLSGSLPDYFTGTNNTNTFGEEDIVIADVVLEKGPRVLIVRSCDR